MCCLQTRARTPSATGVDAMTDRELDALSVLYHLGDVILEQDWVAATVVHAHLLAMLSPDGPRPNRDTAAQNALELAARVPTTTRH
jgi:hypothetical protein